MRSSKEREERDRKGERDTQREKERERESMSYVIDTWPAAVSVANAPH